MPMNSFNKANRQWLKTYKFFRNKTNLPPSTPAVRGDSGRSRKSIAPHSVYFVSTSTRYARGRLRTVSRAFVASEVIFLGLPACVVYCL